MSDMYFKSLPDKSTPLIPSNLDKLNDIKVSPTQPTTNEKVWIQKGKNLLNIENFINDLKNTFSIEETTYNNKNCYKISINKNTHYYNLSNIEENTRYTIQLNLANTSIDFYLMFVYTDGTKSAISQQQLINNLTQFVSTSDTNKTLKQIQVSLYDTSELYIEKETLSLEKGTEATDYEPYIEKAIYVKDDNGVFETFIDVEKTKNNINYSTEEQVIGAWIDGKPIYRRVFTGETSIAQINVTIHNYAENVDTLIRSYGQLENSSGMKLSLLSDDQSVVWANNEFTIYVNNVVEDMFKYTLICEYTKLTD